jgi:hypothetical protein
MCTRQSWLGATLLARLLHHNVKTHCLVCLVMLSVFITQYQWAMPLRMDDGSKFRMDVFAGNSAKCQMLLGIRDHGELNPEPQEEVCSNHPAMSLTWWYVSGYCHSCLMHSRSIYLLSTGNWTAMHVRDDCQQELPLRVQDVQYGLGQPLLAVQGSRLHHQVCGICRPVSPTTNNSTNNYTFPVRRPGVHLDHLKRTRWISPDPDM